MMPLYEAKMIHLYDHQWATYEGDGSTRDTRFDEKASSEFFVMPRYWVHETDVDEKLDGKWTESWFPAWRRIARSTDERTLIASTLPRVAFGDSVFLMLPVKGKLRRALLQAALSSFVLDFSARQKIGGTNASFFLIEQLPVPAPDAVKHLPVPRLESLVDVHVDRLNAWRLDGLERRLLRAELDAVMFHLYGISRDDVAYILETFPIVKRKDIAAHGEYRTKRLILEAYDAMSEAIRTGTPYQSVTHPSDRNA